MTTLAQTGSPVESRSWHAIAAASIGNALEWFDFVVYGFFAVTIAKLFFPAADETVSLLVALATFGVTFFMRPLGAIVLGSFSDRHGRKSALALAIVLMAFGTGIIAVAPTYSAVGLLAPALIVAARLLQGFSAGGEFGIATAFLAEQHPERRGSSRAGNSQARASRRFWPLPSALLWRRRSAPSKWMSGAGGCRSSSGS